MSTDDQHALVPVDGRVQPFSRNLIEVVGGLVQQQYIGFGEQLGGQCQQYCFTAGQRPDRSLEIVE